MGVQFIFNWPEADVCLLICRRSRLRRPAFSPVLLEELAPVVPCVVTWSVAIHDLG
jgi:hypothetical protein